jgi:methionyl-tRNA formyltransferase
MRIVFAGTPALAATALQALIDARFDIALVLTQPDRAAGRGLHLSASAVKQQAARHGLQIAQPPSLRSEAIVASLRASNAQAMVVAAYGLILPPGRARGFSWRLRQHPCLPVTALARGCTDTTGPARRRP